MQAKYEQLIAAAQKTLAKTKKESRHSKGRKSTSSQESQQESDSDEESGTNSWEKASLIKDILKAEEKLQEVLLCLISQ